MLKRKEAIKMKTKQKWALTLMAGGSLFCLSACSPMQTIKYSHIEHEINAHRYHKAHKELKSYIHAYKKDKKAKSLYKQLTLYMKAHHEYKKHEFKKAIIHTKKVNKLHNSTELQYAARNLEKKAKQSLHKQKKHEKLQRSKKEQK